jgi:acyl-coenzyme A thioesterase PaaI-like protein
MAEQQQTHPSISPDLVGEPVELLPGRASARLQTSMAMCADKRGLVHGGFTFGLADYAAMLAVNHPNVVLGGAETRFVAPVRCGELMLAEAKVEEEKGRKRTVHCRVFVDDRLVFEGNFVCFVLDEHVFDQQ